MANLGYLQIARICNQECIFCSNPSNERLITRKEALGMVDDFIEREYDGIILTGGEPTLYPHLDDVIAYCVEKGMSVRMITNAQETSDKAYFKSLVDAGLAHIHVSIQSCIPKIQNMLAQKADSYKKIVATLESAGELGVNVDINTTINHYNAGHLHRNIQFIIKRFPYINHFVWNNLDPTTNRIQNDSKVLAQLWEFEVSLSRAVKLLEKYGKTYRVERVPLCFMAGFEHASTETRKIVKAEERIVFFLDNKGMVRQTFWKHDKAERCKNCSLDPICAGLYEMDEYYDGSALYPVFKDPRPIIERIRQDD